MELPKIQSCKKCHRMVCDHEAIIEPVLTYNIKHFGMSFVTNMVRGFSFSVGVFLFLMMAGVVR